MAVFTVYYSDACSSWKESLAHLMKDAHWPTEWAPVSHLQDCPVGSIVLMAAEDLLEAETPYIGSR
ncbi:hypothetical protein [Marinomonas piezotolerans]|uniref:hypothetical protein n=1 Tax=Marinomonas piezotolerans TaxID=2213058 RepID=UPI0011C07AE8|nr:hypothetical protein [Marinomonas piezotolerans]